MYFVNFHKYFLSRPYHVGNAQGSAAISSPMVCAVRECEERATLSRAEIGFEWGEIVSATLFVAKDPFPLPFIIPRENEKWARNHHGLCSQQKPKSCYILHTDPNRQQELFVLLTYYLSLFPHPTLLCFFNCGNLYITHNLSLEPFQVCRSVREHSHLCNHHHHSSPELTHLLRLRLCSH